MNFKITFAMLLLLVLHYFCCPAAAADSFADVVNLLPLLYSVACNGSCNAAGARPNDYNTSVDGFFL